MILMRKIYEIKTSDHGLFDTIWTRRSNYLSGEAYSSCVVLATSKKAAIELAAASARAEGARAWKAYTATVTVIDLNAEDRVLGYG